MAVAKTLAAIPELITLDDGTEHTVTITGGYKTDPFYTLHVKIVSASTTLKLNNSGDAEDSSRTYVTGDEEFINVDDNTKKLRIKGTASDEISISIL